MPKKTAKEMSVEHEEFIAGVLGGRRHEDSGANAHAPGDVFVAGYDPTYKTIDGALTRQTLVVECKCTEKGSISIKREVWEKARMEADTCGGRPLVALRFRDPHGGRHRDLIVTSLDDFVERDNDVQ